jgi:histidinol-phosphate aminotransferase
MDPRPNPWISAITAYEPGRARLGAGVVPVKLSANENPWGPSPAAIEVIRAHAQGVHRYPDGAATTLRQRIGFVHELDPDRVVVGTGSDELLQLLPTIYCAPGDTVVHVRHGFMVYPIAARRAGAEPLAAPDRDFVADVDAILATVRDNTRIVYLANPNNPTGTMIDRAEVERLANGLRPDIILVIDQAYAEYCTEADPDGGLHLARTRPNVVTTRTFSKIYGLGGLRVGWATGPAAIVRELNRVRTPFPTATLSLVAAETALADQEWVARCREANSRGRARLAAAITALGNKGLRAIPSAGNFILMTCAPDGPLPAPHVKAGFEEDGLIVRHLPAQGLPDALRITIGTDAEVDAVIASLARIAA